MTKIKFIRDDYKYHEYKQGEIGYVDGYIQDVDVRPYAVVIKESGSFVMANFDDILAIWN